MPIHFVFCGGTAGTGGTPIKVSSRLQYFAVLPKSADGVPVGNHNISQSLLTQEKSIDKSVFLVYDYISPN